MKLKSNKGITLTSLIAYIVGMIVIVSIIGTALSFYNKNVTRMNYNSDINIEFNRFDTQMVKETKESGNKIENTTEKSIKFTNGHKYIFQDNRIYQNAIPITENVKEFMVAVEKEGEKEILKIYILLEKGQIELVKNLTYVIENI